MTQPLAVLKLGRWQDALADVGEVDAVITDPPYSPRIHSGFRSANDFLDSQYRGLASRKAKGTNNGGGYIGSGIPYAPLTDETARELAEWTAARCRNWFVAFGDHRSFLQWEDALTAAGWLTFAPVIWVRGGSPPRFNGDGPANCAEYICVARPRRPTRCGSLPGIYRHNVFNSQARGKFLTGQKPVDLMRAIIRDYTAPGELIAEPFAGSGTTLVAAAIEGRRSVGAEMDPDTYAKAKKRLAAGYTPTFDFAEAQ